MARQDTYSKAVTLSMNALQESLQALNTEYYNIMQYFRVQKQRGLLTDIEYNRLANMYKYKK